MGRNINIIQRDTDILLTIDIQNDLLPGGAKPVPNGNKIIGPLLRACPLFKKIYMYFAWFATEHPEIAKPKLRYCVIGSWGAEMPYDLYREIWDSEDEKYESRYFKRGGETGKPVNYPFSEGIIPKAMAELGIRRVFIVGLPLETTVKEAALALKFRNFEVIIFEDAVMPRDKAAGEIAKQDLKMADIRFARTSDFFG